MITVTPHTTLVNLPDHLEHYTDGHRRVVRVDPDNHSEFSLSFSARYKEGYPDVRHNLNHSDALNLVHLFLKGPKAVEGETFDSFINQAMRECECVAVKRTRCRIWYELPMSGETYAWRKIITLAGIKFIDTDPYA